jgi:hypothetical protein
MSEAFLSVWYASYQEEMEGLVEDRLGVKRQRIEPSMPAAVLASGLPGILWIFYLEIKTDDALHGEKSSSVSPRAQGRNPLSQKMICRL